MLFKNKNQLSEKEQILLLKGVKIIYKVKLTRVSQGRQAVVKFKSNLLQNIIEQLENRFEKFEKEDVLKAMVLADNRRWDYFNPEYGMEDISTLAKQFQTPLSYHHFSIDRAKYEFRELKKVVQRSF